MFYALNWNWILLVSWSSLQKSASFSVEQPKSAIKLKLLNWPPWITAFLPGQVDHHWIIFCLHAQRLSKSIKSLDYRLCWFVASMHNFKNFAPAHKSNPSLDLLLNLRTYLRKSLFCWLNLHLQTLKIIILRKQKKAWSWLSFSLASPLKRLEKQCHFFHTKLISHTACDWSCNILLHWFSKIIELVGLFLVWLAVLFC